MTEPMTVADALVHKLGDGDAPLAILEVGTFMGSSLFTWAKSVERLTNRKAEITCVDPWEADDMELAHKVFLNTTRLLPRCVTVTERRGRSHDVLPTLAGQTFDIIYVDGCHLYPEVYQDLQICDGLLAEGGFLCGDDLEMQLSDVDAGVARANARIDYLQDPQSAQVFHPGVTLGVGEFFGPVSVYRGFWVMRKGSGGYEPVPMRGGQGLLPDHWPQNYLEQAEARIREDGLLASVI